MCCQFLVVSIGILVYQSMRVKFPLFSDYHYVTREVMQAAIAKGEFIENAEFSGNMYGTRYSPPY